MIVIVIVGIIASLALPRFIDVAEKTKMAEGKSILGTIRQAQFRYYAENNFYVNEGPWNDPRGLDVDFTEPMFFDWAPQQRAFGGCNPSLGFTRRNNINNPGYGYYDLCIEEDGDIFCSGGAADACTKLGF